MHTLSRKQCRYFNVTVIDAEGKPTTTQLFSADLALAVNWIANRAQYFGAHQRDSIIAAYLFDTYTHELHRYDVRKGLLEEKEHAPV